MTQLFHRSANTLTTLAMIGGGVAVVFVCIVLYMTTWSDYKTGVGLEVEQAVPFSHLHHVRGVGLDCRYCHGGVETSAFAGIPPTKTCMTCHSQLFVNAPMLKPVRDSYQNKTALPWKSVQQLPDFVYFAHDIHVSRGVACSTCHGPVEQMPLMREQKAFYMKDCLECHRAPDRFISKRELRLNAGILTNCSTCHR